MGTVTRALMGLGIAAGACVLVGCSGQGPATAQGTDTSPAVARPAVEASSGHAVTYSGMITIEAMKGSRPVCHAPAAVKVGTWYTVRQYGNARVSFAIPGVPGAGRLIPRTATYTDREFLATRAGTYRIVIRPAPEASCALVVRG
jgi:hypothetical protein